MSVNYYCLRTFSLVVGALGAIWDTITFFGCLILLSQSSTFWKLQGIWVPLFCAFGIIFAFLQLIANIYLIVGAKSESPDEIRIWLVINGVCITFAFILLIVLIGSVGVSKSRFQDQFEVVLGSGGFLSMCVLCVVMVKLFYNELIAKKSEPLLDNILI